MIKDYSKYRVSADKLREYIQMLETDKKIDVTDLQVFTIVLLKKDLAKKGYSVNYSNDYNTLILIK